MQNKYDYACPEHQGLEKKFYYMFNNNFNPTLVSAVQEQFIQPLKAAYALTRTRQCPAESDWDWLLKGIERVLHNCRSGRDFLQSHEPFWDNPLTVSAYFNKLSSRRRLKMVEECAQILCRRVDDSRPSPLAIYKELADFDLFAGDGHYLAAPTHADKREGTAWATGHFFALNLHTQTLTLLALADQTKRKLEQDQHMLKRLSSTDLRMVAPRDAKCCGPGTWPARIWSCGIVCGTRAFTSCPGAKPTCAWRWKRRAPSPICPSIRASNPIW